MLCDSLRRTVLARVARDLRRKSPQCGARAAALPPLALFCDDDRLPDPLEAASRLPPGTLVVARARDPARLRDLAAGLCRMPLRVLVAGDMDLARRLRCGLHLPEVRIGEIARWRSLSSAPVTAAVHSAAAVWRAQALGADAVFLSPVFATLSHPGAAGLGVSRANRIARSARVPVYALGGIDAHTARRLSGFAGLAAVGALSPQRRGSADAGRSR